MANIGYVQITRLCNQKCRFCSNPEIEATLELDEIKRRVRDLADRGYYGVIFTGGEPTLVDCLPDAIRHAREIGLKTRLITNAQKISDIELLRSLKDAGLDLVNISLHSCRESLQGFLTEKPDSLRHIAKALENIGDLGMEVNINTVINKYNADHLDLNVRWLTRNFPFIRHFVWNNIDPTMNRASQNPDTIPRLSDFELSLLRAMRFLDRTRRSFRVERVPLCYMAEYAHCSTETRKIVKGEERVVHFLEDARSVVRQTEFEHGKAACCEVCTLNPICAGLYEMDKYYTSSELYPLFVSREAVIEKIMTLPDGTETRGDADAIDFSGTA